MKKITKEMFQKMKAIEAEYCAKGLYVEAGWQSLVTAVLPKDVPELQKQEMRKCFFAGAGHLFCIFMRLLEEGDEPTASDLRMAEDVEKELRAYLEELTKEARQAEFNN